jgi:methyltransferase (TIGR00027 family)
VATTREQWDIVSSVGLTALGVAAARAVETSRPDALIEDLLAARFVEEAQPPVMLPTSMEDLEHPEISADVWRSTADLLGVRSRFFDEVFADSTAAGIEQVVLLAAGLDVRAYRLAWPQTCHLYEVDQPKVLEFKDAVLERAGATSTCTRHVVGVDLRDDWAGALQKAGFDLTKPTVWLAEGLLPYLPAAAEGQLFEKIDELSAPGSRLAVEHSIDVTVLMDYLDSFQHLADQFGVDVRDLLNFEPRMLVGDRLRSQGWTLTSESVSVAAQRFGRMLDADIGAIMGKCGVLSSGYRT